MAIFRSFFGSQPNHCRQTDTEKFFTPKSVIELPVNSEDLSQSVAQGKKKREKLCESGKFKFSSTFMDSNQLVAVWLLDPRPLRGFLGEIFRWKVQKLKFSRIKRKFLCCFANFHFSLVCIIHMCVCLCVLHAHSVWWLLIGLRTSRTRSLCLSNVATNAESLKSFFFKSKNFPFYSVWKFSFAKEKCKIQRKFCINTCVVFKIDFLMICNFIERKVP